ncbi:MAG: TetR/AcrR family transcriptional regulator, partial [Bacteroidales bacterium]|nr:TetR/AcrR family transcriptional regulator [Bacteroidales bacterium]
FWKHGIKKVSVEEICTNAGTSRVTFYKYFENKEKLALTILKDIVADGMKEYDNILKSDFDYPSKVEKIISMKMRRSEDLSREFLNDLYGPDFPQIQAYFQKVLIENLMIFENDFRDAQSRGDIRKDIKVEFIMQILNRLTDMTRDESLIALYGTSGALISEFTRFFFYGVVQRERKG